MTDENGKNSRAAASTADTATLLRDAVILQGKLVIDGLRDAILIPLSLLAALLSLVQKGQDRGSLFYDVVRMGRRSERWINLFEAADRVYPGEQDARDTTRLDDYLAQVENRLAQELREGGVRHSARRAVDVLLDKIHAVRSNFRSPGNDEQGH